VIACRDLLELISDYLDGSLAPERRAAVEAHIADCDGCSIVLEEFRRTIVMSGRLTEDLVDPAQLETLRSAFRAWAG
jgi:anti-sigma factor RsiW